MNKKTITHIIYDMDGLLLNTEPFYTQATQEVVKKFGKKFEWSLKSKMMGRPAIVSAKLLVEALTLPLTPEEYLQRREKKLLHLFPTALPMVGAKELTDKIKAMNIHQAVATSSLTPLYNLKTKNHKEWFSGFSTIITGDDPGIKNGKPAPDIFLLAAKKMGASPASCLVFEDSPAGVEAGVAAGMHVVAVPNPQVDGTLFKSADQVIDSLARFRLEDWNLSSP